MASPPAAGGACAAGTPLPMGDSEDEFRESRRGRLKAGGPQGGRRLRLRPPPPAPARGDEAEAPGKTQDGGEGGGGAPSGASGLPPASLIGAPPGAGDAAAEEGGSGGGGRCSRHCQAQPEEQAQGSAQVTPEPLALPGASARKEQEQEEEDHARRLPACEEEALRGGQPWGCHGAGHQELRPGSLEEAGWVFCQICQKDLSAMNSVRREQHVNRCLDDLEGPLSAPPARGPVVPECPICGKGFSSLRSRGSHLKRCAARMEVPPTLLLQAVRQQQQQEQQPLLLGLPAAQSGSKRKGASSAQRLPKKRKAEAKVDGATEDLLVAMAMSRSLLEAEEGKAKRLAGSRQDGALQSRKPRKAEKRNRAKLGLPLPPLPLLLPQDPQEARRRMEARVAQLLSEAEEEEFPSTPLLPPSRLMDAELPQGAGGPCGSLWEASSLARRGPPGSFQAADFARSVSLQAPKEGAVLGVALPSSAPVRLSEMEQGPAGAALLHGSPSGESRERLPCRLGDAEALQDLVELAGEGLTLTQWQQEGPGQGWLSGDVLQSSFLQPLEKQLPQRSCPQMLPLGSLADAFRGMVNNPHLSDIQFQVDSGDLLYAHLFVLYARCPQLMEMVGCEGFLVAEEGGAGTRRVLLSDVSKEALGMFLSYLYTADVSVPCHVRSEVAALARRFGATELAGVCHGCQLGPGVLGAQEEAGEDRVAAETFEELLKSMWLEEEEEALLQGGQPEEADSEEVGEQELEQIYEFAATQRKAAHDGLVLRKGAAKPRKVAREPAEGRAAMAEWTGSLCPEQSQLPAAAAASGTGSPLRAASRRVPQMEEEEDSEQHEHSAVLFPATQGDCSRLSQQSRCAREQRANAASQGPASQGFPCLLQGPPRDLLPLGSSSPKRRAASPPSPLAVLSLVPPALSPRGLFSPPPNGELERPAQNKSPGGCGTSEGSPIVLLDSDEEAEQAEAAALLAGAALSGPCTGASQCQSGQGGADVSSGQRPSLSPAREVGPGEPWGAGGRSPLLLRLASNGEDSWEEASSWRVPDTPLIAKPPLVPGSKGVAESPPTHSSTTRLPLLGPPPARKKPASSPVVVVVGDSEEELDSAAPWPPRSPLVPGEDSLRPSEEEEGDSLLCLTANAPTPLGTPPPALGVKSPPARSPTAGGATGPPLGERGASTGEDSDSSEVFPLTQRTPDLALEAGSETPSAAPPTPMPSYSIMETPKLKKELSRFGVRALPKRKMILKLKEIFHYTHQGARGNPQEKAAVAPQLTLPPSPVQPAPRKPRLAVASSSVGKRLPGSAEPRQGAGGSQAVCGFRDPSGRGHGGLGQASQPHASGRLQGTASLPTGFPPGGSTKDSAPTASQESPASSGTGSDVSVASQSSSSMEFGSLVEEEEEEHIPASQAAAREARKLEALRHHLASKPALCRQILLYQPIELAGLQAELKESGVKIAMGKLMDFLDAHCITFTTAEARREKQRHSKKRRRRF